MDPDPRTPLKTGPSPHFHAAKPEDIGEVSPDELHRLATLIGAVGFRWHVIKHNLSPEVRQASQAEEFDELMLEIRDSVRKLLAAARTHSASVSANRPGSQTEPESHSA